MNVPISPPIDLRNLKDLASLEPESMEKKLSKALVVRRRSRKKPIAALGLGVLAATGVLAWRALTAETDRRSRRNRNGFLLAGGLGLAALGLARWQLQRYFTPTPPYEVALHAGSFELRRYPSLQVAETTIAEGGFEGEQEAKFWQGILDDDLKRLQADARATGRANCRFWPGGEQPRVTVALLDAAGPSPAVILKPVAVTRSSTPIVPIAPVDRRRRARIAAGSVLVGVGLGSLGILAGVLDLHRRQAVEMARMLDAATADGGFSPAGLLQHDRLYDDALRTRHAAIGLGVVSAAALSTGIALLVSRKRATRTLALHPHGGLHGGGATLRLRF